MKVQQQLNQQQEIQHQKQIQQQQLQQQLHQEHLQQQQAQQQMQAQAQQQMQAQAQQQMQAQAQQQVKEQQFQQKLQQQQIHIQMQQNQQFQHQQMQKQSQYQDQETNQQSVKQQSTPNTIQQQLQRHQQIQGQQNGSMQHQVMQQANKQKMQNNFQSKQMQMEASLHMQDETWGVPYDLREDMRVQQLIQQEYPLEQRQFYHQRGKPKLTEFQQSQQQQQQAQNSQNKPSAGTISGMLADFSRALGLSNTSPSRPSPTDDKTETDQNPYNQDYQTKDQNQQQYQKAMAQQQIQAQIMANEQFIHGNQQNQLDQQFTQQYQQQQYQQQYQQQQQQAQQHLHQQQQQQQEALMNQQLLQQQRQKEQEYLAQAESDQKQLYQQHQQQMLHKLPEHQPMFAHNLTPQQQQMYQQHMQLQHHAQHLKKIRRSLPHSSSVDQQKQGQFQKKECSLNMLSQSQAVGSGLTMQQMSAAQFLSQSVPLQLINAQYVPANLMTSVTPMGTPQSTPVGTPRGPRDGGDSSDTMSETDSQKSLRTRRKLPSIPADQEAVSFPNSKKRDRVKPKSPHDRFSSYSPLRQYADGGYRIASSNLMLQRPSASETNLRKVTHGPEQIPRPGSALGLLQGSSVVSSGQTIRPDYSSRDSEIASCLPPDLRHLLTSYKNPDSTYSKQTFVPSFKDHFSDEIRLSSSVPERRGLTRLSGIEWDTDRLFDRTKDVLRSPKNRLDIQRKMVYSGIGRNRKLRTHRRQLSDPKLHLDIHPLKESGDAQYGRVSHAYLGIVHPSLRPPYKSYEYESIDDGKRSDWDSSQSYLASYAVAGGALRETAINSVLDNDHYNSDQLRYDMRRYSDSLDVRRHDIGKHRKPRSWQPSPYGSDEDDDQLSREQKKAKIKAEIARRRQQIEENARLHEELLRLARLRESAELGYTSLSGAPPHSGGYAMSSVLKSIDDLLGDRDSTGYSSHRTAEDRSMDRIASTFRTDDYTSGVYERLTDFSPLTDYSTPHAMPLLPDMPTRSRKLLEDLGSSPITESVLSMPQKGEGVSVKYKCLIY
ncbi:hypothetical protein AAG570_012773 [Ranatra chinensis]|uniref:Uncharacterized protein n=1 Tax=Ranatra chinensis TaxID=642074 RepID=A0ABD0YGT1_9HEMI